jgi:hypothetical protein
VNVKAFRGTVYDLEADIDAFLQSAKPVQIKDFRMFPVPPKSDVELAEPHYDVLFFYEMSN